MTAAWPESGFLQVGGKALEYACLGPPPDEAPSLVLLHEGLGCVRLWRDFPAALAEATGMGVFVYSRAGYGRSDPADLPRPLDYMTREAEEVLPHVLDGMGIRRAVLLGHSDGATIAAIYAGGVSDMRVRAVILMAPHFFTEDGGLAEIARAGTHYRTGSLKERMARYHNDPDNTFLGWNDSWLHPDFKKWNVADVLDYIRVPVLAIQGRQDQYGTMAQIEEISTRCPAPVETVVLDDCRHSPFLDKSAETVAEIAKFCDRLWRNEAAGTGGD